MSSVDGCGLNDRCQYGDIGDQASINFDESYNMNNKKRGIFIIINNKNFKSNTDQNTRSGTEKDGEKLRTLGENFGFETKVYNDQTRKNIIHLIKEIVSIDHSENDCLMVAILSHGDEGYFYSTDDIVKLDEIFEPIKKCLSLVNKPKIFIIQACRGTKLDEGHNLEYDGDVQIKKIPIEADFLYAYSTVPGYFSWRNSERGSWFIQALTDVLNQYKDHRMDFLRLLTRVCRRVSINFMSNTNNLAMDKMKQVPFIVSTLTKDLFLTPKIRN